ncbi:STAS-like domain-containing protein [Elusimicrobiota bacterium]
MRIKLKRFGVVLTSRSAGKEAYLSARAYILPKDKNEKVEIDFSGVKVLSPSWADEFLTPIRNEFKTKLVLLPYRNSSIKATLEILKEQHK